MDDHLPSGHLHHLPIARTRLVGREHDIEAVVRLLSRPDVPLVTISGPGGIGKTRLAIHVANILSASMADGVVFIDLSVIADPALVLPVIARPFGVRGTTGRRLLDQLIAMLEGHELLLVLDNFEHVIDAAIDLADVLAYCPQVKVLATSRERLHLLAEHEYPLAPLPIPQDAARQSFERLTEFGAIQLFSQRAQAAQPAFALTAENIQAVADICCRLDGLPLALEMAASRSTVLPPAAMQRRLEHLLPMLTGGSRDLPERQHTMYRTVAWSYNLLSPEEQRFFRMVSVFAGGFTLEAADALNATVTDGQLDTVTGIAALIDTSFISATTTERDDPRYTMFETIREFGLEKLRHDGEENLVRHRHADWCMELAHHAVTSFTPVIPLDVIDRLEEDRANFRSALRWLEDTGRIEEFMRLVLDLGRFWYLGGHEIEGQKWAQRAIARWSDTSAPDYIDALLMMGELAQTLDDPNARQYLEQGRQLAEQSGNLSQEANATKLLGILLEDSGDYDAAEPLLRTAQERYRQISDRWYPAVMEYHLGVVAYGRGDLDRAVALLEHAREEARGIGDVLVLSWSTPYLALIACERGEAERAAALLEAALHPKNPPATLGLQFNRYPIFLGTEAVLATVIGEWIPAAVLLGATEAEHHAVGFDLPEGAAFGQAAAVTRQHIGDTEFSAAWMRGQHMAQEDLDAIVESVLSKAQRTESHASSEGARTLLTPREMEVLRMLVEGHSNREIADTLYISHRTATTHVTNILNKFGVNTRAAAVTYAFQHNLV